MVPRSSDETATRPLPCGPARISAVKQVIPTLVTASINARPYAPTAWPKSRDVESFTLGTRLLVSSPHRARGSGSTARAPRRGARARRRLLQFLRTGQRHIARRDGRLWLRLLLRHRLRRRLKLVEIRFRHGLVFWNVGLFAVDLGNGLVAVRFRVCGEGIAAGIILRIGRRLAAGCSTVTNSKGSSMVRSGGGTTFGAAAARRTAAAAATRRGWRPISQPPHAARCAASDNASTKPSRSVSKRVGRSESNFFPVRPISVQFAAGRLAGQLSSRTPGKPDFISIGIARGFMGFSRIDALPSMRGRFHRQVAGRSFF